MPEYQYKAKDSQGKPRTGSIKAANTNDAKSRLNQMRFKQIVIVAAAGGGSSGSSDDDGAKYLGGLIQKTPDGKINIHLGGEAKPTTKDLIIMSKQMGTMIGSGVSLVQALDILSKSQRTPAMGRALRDIKASIENGLKFSDALQKQPKIFDNLYVSMIRAGEESGKLQEIMVKLVSYIEKAAKMKAQVKSAMAYPVIVLIVALIVIVGMLVFLVPAFAKSFVESGKPLPGITQFVLDISNGLQQNWYVYLGTIVFVVVGYKQYKKTEKGAKNIDKFALKAPVIGDFVTKVSVGRFCSTLAAMITSGVNLIQALTICSNSAGNRIVAEFIVNVRGRIEQGQFLSQPLAENDLFPPMVVSMIQVGEKSGKLDEMLMKISEFYEEEVDLALATMISMIEPIMIVFVGGIVAFLVVAMYMPVFDMANNVG